MPMSISNAARCVTAYLILAACSGSCVRHDELPPAIRLDPVTAIIEALASHQIVALGDWHHNLQLHELRLDLIRDPRFPAVVDDIVVEFGATRYQEVINRYVNGVDVPYEELRRVWVEAPSALDPSAWDRPDTFEFFRTVREVNANLPAAERIRVVAGDGGYESMGGEADLIIREVTDRDRTALIIFGAGHFLRKPLWYPISDPNWMEYWYDHPLNVSTVAHLEAAGVSVFSIHPYVSDPFIEVQPETTTWTMSALTIVGGTLLGVEPIASFEATGDTELAVPNADGNGFHTERVSPDPKRSGLTQEQFDALILLGLSEEMVEVGPFGAAQQQ
jgi:hypothetical protein